MSAAHTRGPILIEGWRFLAHSYAIVNQFQCLEMLRRGCRLAMHDVPYFGPRWQSTRGLFDAEVEAALAGVGPLPAGEPPATVLRLSVPIRLLSLAPAPMAIFCTADSGCLPRAMIEGQRRVGDAVAGTNTRLVTPSAWSRWGLLRSGAQPERIAVVPHGVDTSLFRPASTEQRAAMRRSLGWTGRFVFLNVSAMTDNKGIDLLLRGFAQAAQANSDALLVLKGADELYPSGRFAEENLAKLRQAERSLCEGRLRYIGRTLSFRELAALYQAADAYVSPYRTESFNLPVLEAIASGLPAICTAGGPTDDFTTPDVALRIGSRLLPDPRYEAEQVKLEADLGHLSELMRQAMSDTAFADAARRLGPALVEARFTWKHAVDSLLAALPC